MAVSLTNTASCAMFFANQIMVITSAHVRRASTRRGSCRCSASGTGPTAPDASVKSLAGGPDLEATITTSTQVSIHARHRWRANPFAANVLLMNDFFVRLREPCGQRMLHKVKKYRVQKISRQNNSLRRARTPWVKSDHLGFAWRSIPCAYCLDTTAIRAPVARQNRPQ